MCVRRHIRINLTQIFRIRLKKPHTKARLCIVVDLTLLSSNRESALRQFAPRWLRPLCERCQPLPKGLHRYDG